MNKLLTCWLLSFFYFGSVVLAEDHDHGHEHQHGGSQTDHSGHSEHKSDHHDHVGSPNVGQGKAIREIAGEGSAFRLSGEAVSTLNIAAKRVERDSSVTDSEYWLIQKSSLVAHQDSYSVYVAESADEPGWFRSVSVHVVNRTADGVVISAQGIHSEDRVVIRGAGLLRIAELEASGRGGRGHAH